jgi:hypothetical protein
MRRGGVSLPSPGGGASLLPGHGSCLSEAPEGLVSPFGSWFTTDRASSCWRFNEAEARESEVEAQRVDAKQMSRVTSGVPKTLERQRPSASPSGTSARSQQLLSTRRRPRTCLPSMPSMPISVEGTTTQMTCKRDWLDYHCPPLWISISTMTWTLGNNATAYFVYVYQQSQLLLQTCATTDEGMTSSAPWPRALASWTVLMDLDDSVLVSGSELVARKSRSY